MVAHTMIASAYLCKRARPECTSVSSQDSMLIVCASIAPSDSLNRMLVTTVNATTATRDKPSSAKVHTHATIVRPANTKISRAALSARCALPVNISFRVELIAARTALLVNSRTKWAPKNARRAITIVHEA